MYIHFLPGHNHNFNLITIYNTIKENIISIFQAFPLNPNLILTVHVLHFNWFVETIIYITVNDSRMNSTPLWYKTTKHQSIKIKYHIVFIIFEEVLYGVFWNSNSLKMFKQVKANTQFEVLSYTWNIVRLSIGIKHHFKRAKLSN